MAGALFTLEGDVAQPSELTRGPWDPEAQHGGAPAALLAHAVEAHEPRPDLEVARMTLEFLRPVPLAPLTVHAELTRPGRRVQLVTATLHADGREVCRATALRVRALQASGSETALEPPPPSPEQGWVPPVPFKAFLETFGATAMEQRFVAGDWGVGPATVWFRLHAQVVAGEEPSPLQRVLAAADFGNGVSAEVGWGTHSFINPDLTIYLDRLPTGEWVCLDSRTRIGPTGRATAESALYDERGRIGRSLQALLVDPR